MAVAGHPLRLRRAVDTRLPHAAGLVGLTALAAALALNWWLAAALPSQLFSWTSLALLLVTLALVARISAIAFILLLPFVVTRTATTVSLIAIEAGAYMPEINRLGFAGDASASFVAITALWFIATALVIRRFAPAALHHATSGLLDTAVRWLAWPVLALCLGWSAVALLEGLRSGFPLLAGVDRFLYRRVYSGPFSLALLDNKFVIAAILGAITFGPRRGLTPPLAAGTFAGLLGLFFLFGDKFFTIIVAVMFFLMPLLLRRRQQLVATLVRTAPPLLALVCASFAATLYIYSDYGRLPLDRTATLIGERVAGQGELWFVASRDFRRATNWDDQLVRRNVAVLDDASPPASAFAEGLETHYFIQRYAPDKLARSFRKSGGWVQFTMGTEAMALVMFGYVGVAITMLLGGLLVAFGALYLLRAFTSGFAVSIALAVWVYLQIYFALQQASFWSVAAPGQVKRLLLFLALELVLFAINRGDLRWRERRLRAMQPAVTA